ncbi:hypothetical protein PoB_005265000 [Plakobranchus ocellatus]|uniref:Uncharacterized protein n=1 Tax=Plakobranchus ocellatus TaxID=259542 RepID=A0AAV4C436_9GAST|nr:hypothetical protein PoB_005265000 [Plakobranchus ocellatus]
MIRGGETRGMREEGEKDGGRGITMEEKVRRRERERVGERRIYREKRDWKGKNEQEERSLTINGSKVLSEQIGHMINDWKNGQDQNGLLHEGLISNAHSKALICPASKIVWSYIWKKAEPMASQAESLYEVHPELCRRHRTYQQGKMLLQHLYIFKQDDLKH